MQTIPVLNVSAHSMVVVYSIEYRQELKPTSSERKSRIIDTIEFESVSTFFQYPDSNPKENKKFTTKPTFIE